MNARAATTYTNPVLSEHSEFLFHSAQHAIRAHGVLAQITTPALDGEQADSLFQRTLQQAFAQAQHAGQANPIVIGAIPFDVSQPSCLYIPQRYDNVKPTVPAVDVRQLAQVLAARSIPDEHGFKAAVRQAIANFQHSEIRKTVLSRVYELQLAEPVVIEAILANLQRQNPHGYHFRIPMHDGSQLIGASPELLLRKYGAQLESNPLAGSAKRQTDSEQDQQVSQALLQSGKDLYEHRLVIEEIGRRLQPYCYELHIPEQPELLSTAAMWHLSTPIQAQLHDPQRSALQLACLLHPTPAVCGFPTSLARKLINLVEPFERGVFTGMVGWCDAQGNGEWVVTIRCATVKHDQIRLFAGAGIVEASCPEAEWAETQAKLGTMLNAFGIQTQGALSQ